MRRLLCFLVLCVGMMFCLTSCGISDWSYELLPGDYEIWRVNSHCIVLGRQNGESGLSHVMDTYVYAFCYNQRFIGIHGLDTGDDDVSADVDIRQAYKNHAVYFLVDTQTHGVYGPLTWEGYAEMLVMQQVEGMCDWIETFPKPDGAV